MTSKLPIDVLESLGLRESDLLGEPIVAGPREGVALGATAGMIGMTGGLLLQAMVETLGAGQPQLAPIESERLTAKLEACAPGAYALQIQDDPRGVLVRVPGAHLEQHHGTCQLLENDEMLLASGGPGDEGWVLIDGPTGSMLLGCVNGGELWGQGVASRAVRTIAAWQPDARHDVIAPSVASLTHGLGSQPWLQAAADLLMASPAAVDRCAAVGLLGRLWLPPRKNDVQAALQISLRGAGPGQTGRTWWAALPPEHRHTVIRDALLRIDNLMDDLPELRSRVAADPVRAAPLALDWLRRRDDLQALLYMAHCTSDARVLEGALQTLDERAAAEHSIWFFLPPFDDERLRAVASAEPDAWWGDLSSQQG